MKKKRASKISLCIFFLIAIYCQITPINLYGSIWEDVTEGALLMQPNILFPVIFFIQTLAFKYPLKNYFKIILCIEAVYIIITMGMMSVGLIMGGKFNEPYFSIFLWYIIFSNLFFSLWSLALATPLSKYKFFNWPFKIRDGYEFPSKTTKTKRNPYISKSGRTRPSNKYYGK